MPRHLSPSALATALALSLTACVTSTVPEPASGRWIHFDATTQRYSVDATQVPRQALLDELRTVSKAQVRTQTEPDAPVTAHARSLDLQALVELLLPPGTHATVRPGERDIAALPPGAQHGKQGPALRPDKGLVPKPLANADDGPRQVRGERLKAAFDVPVSAREPGGPGTKPEAKVLLDHKPREMTKQALPLRLEGSTVRLVLQFEDGAAPRLVAAQTLPGRAPPQRFVVGSMLFAVVGADGQVLDMGSFNDPLLERSYQPEGPHGVSRAKTGVVGISVPREHLAGARVRILDMADQPLPRELTEEVVRRALKSGRETLQLDTETILRMNRETQP